MIAKLLARHSTALLCAVLVPLGSSVTLAGAEPGSPEDRVASALSEALRDEYLARDTYRAVLQKHGPVRPFSRIVDAEQRHIDALLEQFARLGLEAPQPGPAPSELPPTVREACRLAAAAEITNAEMYDRLIERASSDEKVVATFRRLREASIDRHLPAFQRCAERRGHDH